MTAQRTYFDLLHRNGIADVLARTDMDDITRQDDDNAGVRMRL